jgi:outer membrane protein assembly factor BamA
VEYLGGPLDPSLFSVATERLMGHPYSAAYARSLAENDLSVIYHNHGYLHARFSEATPSFIADENAGEPGKVSLAFTVAPGVQYTWNGADWNGELPYTAAELDQILAMKPGEVAGSDKIAAGIGLVHIAYGKKGYINAVSRYDQNFDDSTRQVHMSFQLQEGDQYHMGAFNVTGASNQISDRIVKAWRLKTGEIYNASYWKNFADQDLPNALKDMGNTTIAKRLSYSEHPNPKALTVDVLLTLE